MADILLATKLHIPGLRRDSMPRPHLVECIAVGPPRRLTLISAPAGFGKTTLLSQWVAQTEERVAWLSLDEGDNDNARFLAYFIAALQTVEPKLGTTVRDLLQSPKPPTLETALSVIMNECVRLTDRLVLVLDDYHVITDQPVHDSLAFLLDHLPPQMHLVIATRADPPLPLARLRARDQLNELRAVDLRFAPGEIATFLNQVMGLHPSANELEALAARTEGWIAGLQLAALSMQGHEDTSRFIRSFAGSHRYILDYLIDEVLNRQPEHIRTFLMQTAILDRLTGALCDAVTGQAGSQLILASLEKANLFVIPLDDQRRWYRYHHLFAEALQARFIQELGQTNHPSVLKLHLRAAQWYEQNGLTEKAIDHALAAQDFQKAADLIERAGQYVLARREAANILRWLQALPDNVVNQRCRLRLYQAWALLYNAKLEQAEGLLRDLQVSGDKDQLIGEIAAIRAAISIFRFDMRHVEEYGLQALSFLPEGDTLLRPVAAMCLSARYIIDGHVEPSIQALADVARMSRDAGNRTITVLALTQLAELQVFAGKLRQATETYHEALQLAVDEDNQPLLVAGLAYVGLAEVLRYRNDLEGAVQYLTLGIELSQRLSLLAIGSFDGYFILTRVKLALGDTAGALAVIATAEVLAHDYKPLLLDDVIVSALKALIWLAQGRVEAAVRWAEETGLLVPTAPPDGCTVLMPTPALYTGENLKVVWRGESAVAPYQLWEMCVHVVARFLLAQERWADALNLLESLKQAAEVRGRYGIVLTVLAMQACAQQSQGKTAQAVTTLERALALAEPEGYVRIFLDEGEPMARLLGRLLDARRRGPFAESRPYTLEFVNSLLSAFRLQTSPITAATLTTMAMQSLVEPLGARELEVLRLAAAGLSNLEIAERLVISLSTVKWHINNIFGKLNVSSRTQAIARARDLALL